MLDRWIADTIAFLFLTTWMYYRFICSGRIDEPHTVFLYSAVYDDRTLAPRVRILGYSWCFGSRTTFELEVGGVRAPLHSAEVIANGACPDHWAAGFDYQEFEFVSEPLPMRPSEITFIVNSVRNVTMPVRPRIEEKDEKLEMCVVPLFWYANWPRLLTWIEHWRLHHNASFIIYKHTVSKNVDALLQYYEKKGVVKIVPWPQMPINRNDDLRTQLYRIGNKVAANDCLSRLSNKFAAWLDVDEYVGLSSNQTLLNFAREKERIDDRWGSLAFKHHALTIPPIDETFSFVDNAEIHKVHGPPKQLFMPSRIQTIYAHGIYKYVGNYHQLKVDANEARLLHMRVGFQRHVDQESQGKFSDFTSLFRERLLGIAHEIYGEALPKSKLKAVQLATDRCITRSRKDKRTTKGPATPYQPETCGDLMEGLDDWVVAQPTADSRYYYV